MSTASASPLRPQGVRRIARPRPRRDPTGVSALMNKCDSANHVYLFLVLSCIYQGREFQKMEPGRMFQRVDADTDEAAGCHTEDLFLRPSSLVLPPLVSYQNVLILICFTVTVFISCCDGGCGRSFHPTKPTGDALELPEFLCENCKSKKHQCFVCGELASSDQGGKEQVIIQCNKRGCKRFYHPECLPLDVNKIPEESCPMHECYSCKKKHATSAGNEMAGKRKGRETCREKHATSEGNKTTGKSNGRESWELDLVLCRRCPKAFHRKCLPRKISGDKGKIQRRWETAGGTVFYCRDHEMVEDLRSAERNHIKFREEKTKGASENQGVPESGRTR